MLYSPWIVNSLYEPIIKVFAPYSTYPPHSNGIISTELA
jgi:hypothetical protein